MKIDKLLQDFLFHCKFEKNLNPKTIYKNPNPDIKIEPIKVT